ncbi:hypothetical protein [Sporosarcina cascadiensis]|uniref:hypothetical protein n=1 Tax=Sporosarcina cascadiensis TaxID=2660747 RepID=UPI00129A30A3|nr:hypothetical protein [Sporosarcina cascadiensis]
MRTIYPKLGEKLIMGGNKETKAYIPASVNGRTDELLNRYYHGFKKIADAGVQQIIENPRDNAVKDMIIFPIIFNYRHFLELLLKKYAIKYAKDKKDYEELGKNLAHNLEFYWKRVKPILEEVYKGADFIDEVAMATESYILQFQELDNGSFTFRYPFAKGEEFAPFFEEDLHIDVVHLKERVDELYNILEYMEDQLEHNRQNEEYF